MAWAVTAATVGQPFDEKRVFVISAAVVFKNTVFVLSFLFNFLSISINSLHAYIFKTLTEKEKLKYLNVK